MPGLTALVTVHGALGDPDAAQRTVVVLCPLGTMVSAMNGIDQTLAGDELRPLADEAVLRGVAHDATSAR